MRSLTWAAVLAALAVSASARAADLPVWKMAELKTLSEANWGPAAKDGERQYRPVLAGKSASWTVPMWWGESFRPAEDTIYVFKISYKDTVVKPAVFYSHGGLGSYWGLSEVHRFGGAADGQWKTADVPVSWDLVCKKNAHGEFGKSTITEFAINAGAELPVESITVTLAGSGAAEKYFAETRAWVAAQQADKRQSAGLGAKQEPVLPDQLKDKPLVPFARSYLVPVMPNAAPQKGEAGSPLKLRMARNEYELATFGVYANGKDLKGVKFTVGDLAGDSGKLECEIELRTAEYTAVTAGSNRYELYPQQLWPAFAVDIPSGRSHWFWVTVHTLGEKSKPGKYAGTVKITADGAEGTLPIEVEVVPVTLLTMQEAKLELGPCGFCSQQELRTMAQHNHTGLDIWYGGTQPQVKVDKDKKMTIDWTYLDDWMAYAVKCGMTHMMWFMGGDPYGFPDTLNLERDLYRAQPGENAVLRTAFIEKTMAKPEKVIDELRPLYLDFITQLSAHQKQKNWPKLIIHPFDEPAKWVQNQKWQNPFHEVKGTGPWIKDHFQDCCALIRQGAKGNPNILTGGDIHHVNGGLDFVKDIDVFCTNAIHEDLKLGDKVRAAGTQFWQYSGGGDHAPPHQGRFTFGFYFGAFDARGYLIWAYNMFGRFDTATASQWGYGWYTPFGTVYTPYMAGVREGCDDRRWMETYKKLVVARDPSAGGVLAGIGQEAIAQRTGGGRDTVSDFYAEMQRLEQMDVWRNKLIDGILKTGK